jgi:hypothetical protein
MNWRNENMIGEFEILDLKDVNKNVDVNID